MLGALGSLAATALSYFNTKSQNSKAMDIANQNIAYQKDMAQHGIQYRVEDAKRSGIHPLYALGANTTSFAPVSVGQSSTDFSGLGKVGQDIGRAIDSTRQTGDRPGALQTSIAAAQLDGLKIDNDIKRAELASKLATNVNRGPGFPAVNSLDGQGDAIKLSGPKMKIESRRDVTDPRSPAYIPGSGPSVGVMKNTTGGYSPVIPPELAESLESDTMGTWDWMIRNRVLPNFGAGTPPHIPHNPYTEMIVYNPWRQQWEVRKKGDTNEARSQARRLPAWAREAPYDY